VIVGRKVAVGSKLGAYKIPVLKRLIHKADCDFVILDPSKIVREEPFVLPYVLGFMGLPDTTKWCPPDDPYLVVGIIKLARAWKIEFLLSYLASILEIDVKTLRHGKGLCGLVRSKLR